jgi:hypothetical protein
MRKLFNAALVLLTLTTGQLFGANILANPGFETGSLAPWTNSNDFCGGCLWTVENADANTGTSSAVLFGNRLILQTFAPVATSSITEASFWARHPDAGPSGADVAAYFEYSDASSEEVIVSTTGTAWSFFDVFVELDPGKELTGFGVYGNSDFLARFDDAVIDVSSAVPEPSTWLLLATGAGLLALRRHRSIRN